MLVTEASPCFTAVRATLVKTAKASAPRLFFEQCETLRAITAGRSARSARLLVGSTAGLCRKLSTRPRSCCQPIPSNSPWPTAASSCSARLQRSPRPQAADPPEDDQCSRLMWRQSRCGT